MIGLSPYAYWRRRIIRAVMRLATPHRQLEHSIANVRHDMAALGFPIAELSDDELIDGLRRVGEMLRAATPTMDEAARSIQLASRAWRGWGERWKSTAAHAAPT